MARRAFLICGILSSLVYLGYDVAALRYQGYSYTSQTISELTAIGAPSRSLVVVLGMTYDALLIAFGVGVWQSAARKRALRIVGILLVAVGLIGFAWPPMHMRGAGFTLTDTMHIVFAGVTSLLIVLAVGFGAAAFGTRFRVYSIASILTMLVFGTWAGSQGARIAANLPTPWVGVIERVDLGAYLLWVVVLAVTLLRGEDTAIRDNLGAGSLCPRASSPFS
jgi:hypothetical protein